jgi:hypothetical protein
MTATRTRSAGAGLRQGTALVLAAIALVGVAGGATAKDKTKASEPPVTGTRIATPRGDVTVMPTYEVNGAVGDGRAQPLDADEAARPTSAAAPEIAADEWLPQDDSSAK